MTEQTESYSPFKPKPVPALRRMVGAVVGSVKAWVLARVLDDDALYRRHVQVLPDRLFMMTATICNARCVFCPQSSHIDPKIVMEDGVFDKVITEFAAMGGIRITINSNNGEALVDPKFGARIKQMRAAGVRFIDGSTNGILLGRGETAAAIAEMMSSIRISMPGLDPEDYKRVYGVDKAKELRDGLEKLARIKTETGSALDIVLDLRIDRPLAEVLKDEGMAALAPMIESGVIRIDYEQLYSEMETWSDLISDDQLPGIMTLRTDAPPRPRPCKRLFSDVAVLADGRVRVCACRYRLTNYDDMIVGDTRTERLEDIVLGPVHRRLLQRVAAGDWPQVCHGCTLYQSMDFPQRTWLSMVAGLIRALIRR